MSHSLARLREALGDPLFVQVGRRLVPTARAQELALALPRALDQLGVAVSGAPPFDPAVSRRSFRLATLDYFELTTLTRLLHYLERHAPGVRLEVERFAPAHLQALDSGEVDLALVGTTVKAPPGVRRATLYEDAFAVILRKNHPLGARRKLDLETFIAQKHVLVNVEGRGEGAVDRALARLGRTREVELRVPHFSSALLAVAESNCICTIAASVAARGRELFGLRVVPPPLELPAAGIAALWSRRHEDDPASVWFRNLFLGDVLRLQKQKAMSRPPAITP
jgi:DNA-binding transcriptional LysR family regulator